MPHVTHPQKYLLPSGYACVMGLCGLALAWFRAASLMGEAAPAVAAVTAGMMARVFALVFALLAVATVLHARRHPQAWAEDRRHPVRHARVAALPISLILLAAVAVPLLGPSAPLRLLWWAGALAPLATTLWVAQRWWRGNGPGSLQWSSATPALFLPIMGNLQALLVVRIASAAAAAVGHDLADGAGVGHGHAARPA